VARNSIRIPATPDSVFAVLDDACAYPRWVVGARRIRGVDASWPEEGSSFRHALGAPGAEVRDSSTVVRRDPPHEVVLEVRFRPTGVARVEMRVEPTEDGCVVTMEETPIAGPVTKLPRPVVDPILRVRNALALRRLRGEVQRRLPDSTNG
jgi:uncharacterized protein YndB with AHSA1/START domain